MITPAIILYAVDLAGVAVFAVSGAITAGRKGMDLLGVFVVASLTAIGGGTLRDLLLDRHPIFWLRDSSYLVVIGAATAFTVLYSRVRTPAVSALLIADALGLGFFTISGAQIAEQARLPALSIVLMGTMTGSAGGVLRDVICNEVPLILRPGQLYATASIVGTTTYIAARHLMAPSTATALGMATVVLLRLAAILWGLRLPKFELRAEERRT